MRRTVVAVVVALSLGAIAGAALAQAKPEVMVKQRQAVMTLQGKYFGPVGGNGAGQGALQCRHRAAQRGFLDNLSRMPWDGFDPRPRT